MTFQCRVQAAHRAVNEDFKKLSRQAVLVMSGTKSKAHVLQGGRTGTLHAVPGIATVACLGAQSALHSTLSYRDHP